MADFSLDNLLYLMERLRDPEDGCPWDIAQNWSSILPSTLEEAYEVADVIERQDFDALTGELGDLLFQVIFYSQLGKEKGYFEFTDVVDSLVHKLIRRHPHVFPQGTLESRRSKGLVSESEVRKNWESIKETERAGKGQLELFADVPLNLPALTRSQKLQKRAARIGFDWSNIADVVTKIEEEIQEFKVELDAENVPAIERELGDLLFSVVNLCRHLKIDAESALRHCGQRFERRFESMEKQLQDRGRRIDQVSQQELEECWVRAKEILSEPGG